VTALAATPPDARPQRRPGFRPDIQGLRAIAVLLVVLYHSGVSGLSGGFVGVDVFFVISGFLITTHLLETLSAQGRISFGSFYAKRARRILPASLLVGLLTVIAAWIWMPPLLMSEVTKGALAAATYVPNMLFAVQGTNYLAESAPSVFQHYWSLGVEEQFYLFWPAILGLGFWLFGRRERRLLVLVAALALVSLVLCCVMMEQSQPWAFFSLPTRAWELATGGLVAFLLRTDARWLRRAPTGALAWIGLGALLLVGVTYEESTPFPGLTAVPPVVATALLIIGGAAPGRANANRLLALAPFQWIGAISYSLYLVHWPLQIIPQAAVGQDDTLPLSVRLLLGAAAFPAAWLLYRLVERPVIAWRVLKKRSQLWTAAAALTASIALVATAGGAYLTTSTAAIATQKDAAQSALTTDPEGTGYVPSNLVPDLEDAEDDNPTIYDDDCHRSQDSTDASGCRTGDDDDAPLVFLFGDSHAASWYPALAELADQGKIRLDVNTKSSCYSADIEEEVDGVPYDECDQWRQGVLERIDEEQPDLVLLANYPGAHDELVPDETDFPSRWQSGLTSTIRSISGPEVAVVADVPHQAETSSICLSAHLEDTSECAASVDEALEPDLVAAEEEATSATDAHHLDLTSYLCNEETCPPIIGRTLVYRDDQHLTAHFSREMSEPLWKQIRPLVG
jgi:peptidoglycan/LPS O-acetylase OafA/YrhL